MATYRGYLGIIKAVTTAGSLANVGEVKSWSLEEVAEVLEDTSIGDADKTFVAGMKDWTCSLEAHYDAADVAQEDLIVGATVDLELRPEGSTAGKTKITCTGIVTRARVNNEGVAGIVSYSVDIEGNSAVALGTVPA